MKYFKDGCAAYTKGRYERKKRLPVFIYGQWQPSLCTKEKCENYKKCLLFNLNIDSISTKDVVKKILEK
ncbi:unnamed protein product [marine sediment metagenome]|uniref:Uncharacterized protein n=1 Tax=marine sediment metagenome TaxID=412755 RepID=X1F8X3_9ZZZZ